MIISYPVRYNLLLLPTQDSLPQHVGISAIDPKVESFSPYSPLPVRLHPGLASSFKMIQAFLHRFAPPIISIAIVSSTLFSNFVNAIQRSAIVGVLLSTARFSDNRFTQQELPACRPILTPRWNITILMLIGVIFIPIGVGALLASRSVVEIVYRYETECIPEVYRNNKLAYIQNDLIPKNCSKVLKVQKHMKAPIYIYYQLDHFYQNHRRYVKSRSDKQLLYGLRDNSTISYCDPETKSNGVPIVPCGLIAWSLFNDTYRFSLEDIELHVNKTNIAWKSDREHKFGKNVYPFNFQTGPLIGGAKLDPSVPLSNQEDLIVWMRISALPTFRKLYGRIEVDLEADDYITVEIQNNYNTYSFRGKKSLVLSTASWLGGKNDTLGKVYIVTGILCILLALVFFILHIKLPRTPLDLKYISCHKKDTIGQSSQPTPWIN